MTSFVVVCQSKVDELFLRFNGIIDQIKNLLFSILSLLSPFEVKTLLYFLGTLCISFGDCSDPSCHTFPENKHIFPNYDFKGLFKNF